jgi:hypothetical protein
MTTRCSEDSGIFRPRFNFSAPSPLGYFDNLFTPSSPSLLQQNRPSNTPSSVMSDLKKSEPEAFHREIFGTAENDSASENLSMSDCSSLYVLMILEYIQRIMNLFRSEHYVPPCPSPDFLETLDTSHSTHNIVIIAKMFPHPDSNIPIWKIHSTPAMKLVPGLFVQGPFGQGVIQDLSHDDENFQYYMCYTFNNGPIFLMLQQSEVLAQPNWWKNFVVRCKNLLCCV